MLRPRLSPLLALLVAAAPALAQPATQPAGGWAPEFQPGMQADPPAATQPASSLGLTIYSQADPMSFDPQLFIAQARMGYQQNFASQVPGFGVIRDTRTVDLQEGMNSVSFTDVAQFIDPTSVTLTQEGAKGSRGQGAQGEAKEGADAGIRVIEQNFQFDLVSPQKLLEKYLDQEVTVNVARGDTVEAVKGKLLSATQGIVLQTPTGVRLLPLTYDVQLGELPEGLITRPTLEWKIFSPTAGKKTIRTAYQADGITWRSDYNLVLNADDTAADLGAWVTIMNLSGARFENAQLKLIAGDVQRFKRGEQQPYPIASAGYDRSVALRSDDAAGFEERSFAEYHLYTLPRPVTIEQNSTGQIALFPTVQGVEVEKVLVYSGLPDQMRYWIAPTPNSDRDLGGESSKKVDVYIRFDNEKANKLGMPLPKGKVRVYKVDTGAEDNQPRNDGADNDAKPAPVPNPATEGTLEFIGEDLIDHTSEHEEVLIKIGQSFDVTGERTQTDLKVDLAGHEIIESFEITVSNAKDIPQKVVIRENLYRWTNWEITKQSDEHEKIDYRTIHYEVTVPAHGEKTVTYTVKYTW